MSGDLSLLIFPTHLLLFHFATILYCTHFQPNLTHFGLETSGSFFFDLTSLKLFPSLQKPMPFMSLAY